MNSNIRGLCSSLCTQWKPSISRWFWAIGTYCICFRLEVTAVYTKSAGINKSLIVNICFCFCVFVFLYLRFWHMGISFWTSLNNPLFRNIPHGGYFLAICHMLYLCVCVFVYLCTCIFVFALLTHGNIIFDILEQSSFQKYTTWWVFLALCHMLYLCICVFVYLCICIWVGKVATRPIWPKKCQSAFFNFLIWEL